MEPDNKNQIYNLKQLKKQYDNLSTNKFILTMGKIYVRFSTDNFFGFAKERLGLNLIIVYLQLELQIILDI